MNFFADEGLDFPLVNLLRLRGHKIIYAAEEMRTASDDAIFKNGNRAGLHPDYKGQRFW